MTAVTATDVLRDTNAEAVQDSRNISQTISTDEKRIHLQTSL